MTRLLARSLPLVLLALGCRSTSDGADGAILSPELDRVEAEIRAGEFARALARLEDVHAVRNVPPDVRAREERLVAEAARGRFAELAEGSPEDLEEIFESELPPRVRARAGILAAERELAAGNRVSAYRMVKRVDEEVPQHIEGVLAGDVVARAGLDLIRDPGRYLFLFRYRSRGIQALEYLVVHYPLEPRCAEAYFSLSEAYERDGKYDEAIARSEELLLYHPGSVYAPAASARLAYLRLARLQRDDYDRGELQRAWDELASWIARYPEHELAGWVADLQAECARRLVQSDLDLAEFYRRTENAAGQRLHAERARELALARGLASEAARAAAYCDELPGAVDTPAAVTASSAAPPAAQP